MIYGLQSTIIISRLTILLTIETGSGSASMFCSSTSVSEETRMLRSSEWWGRFTAQKGYNLLAEVFEPILNSMHVQFAILGTGETDLEQFFQFMAHKYGDRVGVHIGFSEELAHLVEAGSDFFLMPSRFEPCGLNQMYSLRYGTLPIVRATGGLNDTVENYNHQNGDGTGFKFYDFTEEALYYTINWAASTYYDRRHHIEKMRYNGMQRRFTWDMSAAAYEYAYLRAMGLH